MKLSIVIPAFNEAENIETTLLEIKNASKNWGPFQWEVILVDDHSQDGTWEQVTKQNLLPIRAIRLSRQSGSHTAIRAGLFLAKGDVVVCLSADGQDPPGVIHSLLEQWKKGAQIVWALRKKREEESFFSSLFAKCFYKLLNFLTPNTNFDTDLNRADFYLLDRSVVDSINQCKETHTSLFGLINWVGFSHGFIEYNRPQRRFGKSKWNFKSKLRLAFDWIVGFSGTPLRLVTLTGIFSFGLGLSYAIWVLIHALLFHPNAGWSSLMIVILLLGGTQLLSIGILGEYLLRNLNESRERPLYFIEKRYPNTPQEHNTALHPPAPQSPFFATTTI